MFSLDWHLLLNKHRSYDIGVGSDQEPQVNGGTIEMRYAAPGSYVDTVIVTVIY
jgi:spore coat protein U-like protein